MHLKFSAERAAQQLVSLLKQHNIKKIVASPGATNITFLATAMHDPWFEIYSSVDERSAAYIACGLAEESREPVVLTCTGATSSRNYMPGLTEAYYRKLPILAITASQPYTKIGHLPPQMLDRRNIPNDVARKSYTVYAVKDSSDEWANEIAINSAIIDLSRHGGGPVHINFETLYSKDFSVNDIVPARKISHIDALKSEWPDIPTGRVGIFVGSHSLMSSELTEAIDNFCSTYDSVVFCDHTSNYFGHYRVNMAIPFQQETWRSDLKNLDLLIHIGEVSGDYPSFSITPKQVWRVNPDGELRDFYRKLTYVFEMPEIIFFSHYGKEHQDKHYFLDACKSQLAEFLGQIPELPFSNTWIAQHTANRIPKGSIVHLGILNTLRNWNYFQFSEGVRANCNVGGFGIDGIVSSALGASLSNPHKLTFVILGDLAFFYDMNAIGNRHVNQNLRVMVINNGRGTEFRNYNHNGAIFGDESDKFIAAAGHFGNKSPFLLRHYAEDLGFEYITASNKEEYLSALECFINPQISSKPIFFEVFTDSKDESDALQMIQNIKVDNSVSAKKVIRDVIGDKGVKVIRNILNSK